MSVGGTLIVPREEKVCPSCGTPTRQWRGRRTPGVLQDCVLLCGCCGQGNRASMWKGQTRDLPRVAHQPADAAVRELVPAR